MNNGFTLMEVLIVMAMFVTICAFGLLVSMDAYYGSHYHSDRNLLVAVLQRARSQAINNVCVGSECTDGKPHGVVIYGHTYILYQGYSSTSRDVSQDAVFQGDPTIARTGDTDIVFSQIAGTTTGAVITLIGSGRSTAVTVSTQGQITWTH